MLFGADFDIDANVSLSINLRLDSDKVPLYACKGKVVTETEICNSIGSNKSAMLHIRLAAKRGQVLSDDGLYLVPVALTVTPIATTEPITKEADIWVPDLTNQGEAAAPKSPANQAGSLPADQVQFLKSLHDMSLQTIGVITKSANESIARVAAAQAEALKALTMNFNQVQQSIERLGSLPTRIFEDSNEKVEALLVLAQERAQAKLGEQAQSKDVLTELKDLVGIIQTMKGALG